MHNYLQPPASGTTEKGATEKGNERIRSILEEAKNALVDEGFSGLSFRLLPSEPGNRRQRDLLFSDEGPSFGGTCRIHF